MGTFLRFKKKTSGYDISVDITSIICIEDIEGFANLWLTSGSEVWVTDSMEEVQKRMYEALRNKTLYG